MPDDNVMSPTFRILSRFFITDLFYIARSDATNIRPSIDAPILAARDIHVPVFTQMPIFVTKIAFDVPSIGIA